MENLTIRQIMQIVIDDTPMYQRHPDTAIDTLLDIDPIMLLKWAMLVQQNRERAQRISSNFQPGGVSAIPQPPEGRTIIEGAVLNKR